MQDSGTVTIEGVNARKSTDKQSGIHIHFSQTLEGTVSETHKSATHRERHGKLAVKINGKMQVYTGKLTGRTVYAEKIGENGKNVYTFVPGARPSAAQFKDLFSAIDDIADYTFEDEQKEMKFNADADASKEPVEAATDL